MLRLRMSAAWFLVGAVLVTGCTTFPRLLPFRHKQTSECVEVEAMPVCEGAMPVCEGGPTLGDMHAPQLPILPAPSAVGPVPGPQPTAPAPTAPGQRLVPQPQPKVLPMTPQ